MIKCKIKIDFGTWAFANVYVTEKKIKACQAEIKKWNYLTVASGRKNSSVDEIVTFNLSVM